MLTQSLRVATRYRGGWTEFIELTRPDVDPHNLGQDRSLVGEYRADVSDVTSPVMVHETALDPSRPMPKLGTNREATTMLIPHEALTGSVVADELLDEDRFWKFVGNLKGYLAIPALRRGLRRQPATTVLAFQARLIERCTAMMARQSVSWARAGELVTLGPVVYERYFDGGYPRKLDTVDNFSDLTDIAEDILGTHIEVPGYGDSRTGLGASKGDYTRYLAWRALTHRDGRPTEVFYIGERSSDTPMREMPAIVRQAMERDGLVPAADIETWYPDMVHSIEESSMIAYAIRRSGPENFDDYLAANAIPRLA